ncbi:MAG TPA: threonine--tRNA ligase, partial [Chloroflexota bacterium]
MAAPEIVVPLASEDELYRIRHSAAHIMAQAVLEQFPNAKLGIGPPIDSGFYYDFLLPRSLTPDDLASIEERMRQIIAEDHPFIRRTVTPQEARKLFMDQPFKLELIDGLAGDDNGSVGQKEQGISPITTYRQSTFEDLCRGPHVERTGQVPAEGLKLVNVSGAYWRGDEKNPMLQRIYGTAWKTKDQLDDYFWRL